MEDVNPSLEVAWLAWEKCVSSPVEVMQKLQALWHRPVVFWKSAFATHTQRHSDRLLHSEGVHTRISAILTISLLSIVSDIIQSIGTVRIKPHQARQQRLGVPHTHACQKHRNFTILVKCCLLWSKTIVTYGHNGAHCGSIISWSTGCGVYFSPKYWPGRKVDHNRSSAC